MYLEILHKVVCEILTNEGKNKQPIVIELTPSIYDSLQKEVNECCTFKTNVPIMYFTFSALKFYGRTVTINKGDKLNPRFERNLVDVIQDANIEIIDSQNDDTTSNLVPLG